MELVNEEDHIPHPSNLGHDVFDPFLKLAPVLGPRHHCGQVQGDQPLALQLLRYLSGHHHSGQAFGHRRLAHARFANEGRVVFLPPGQDLDHPPDLLVPPHHRVQLTASRQPGQVPCKLLQHLGLAGIIPLGTGLPAAPKGGRRRRLPSHGGGQVAPQTAGLHPSGVQHPDRHAVPLTEDTQQQVLRAHILVAQTHRLGEGEFNDLLAPGVSPWEGAAPGVPTPTSWATVFFSFSGSRPAAKSTLEATPRPSPASPSSRCSLPT